MIEIFATLIFMASSALMAAGVVEDKYMGACEYGPIILDVSTVAKKQPSTFIENPKPDYKIFTCVDLDLNKLIEK